MSSAASLAPGIDELIGAAFHTPVTSLLLAAVAAGVVAVVATRPAPQGKLRTPTGSAPRDRAHVALGVASIGILAGFFIEYVLRGYVFPAPEIVAWWRFAVPLLSAGIGSLAVLIVLVMHDVRAPRVRFIDGRPRRWWTFSSRGVLFAAAVTASVLVVTTIAAGSASSPTSKGDYTRLELPVPNEDVHPLGEHFYGWTYGVPVLFALVALLVIVWGLLRANAARPYRSPESVAAEAHDRRRLANGSVAMAGASALLSLAEAWRLIGDAGRVSTLTIMGINDGAPYDVIWEYASLASVAGVSAPLLEIAAFTVLLLVAANELPRRSTRSAVRVEERVA